jgi:transposase
MNENELGIDVSKETLDVILLRLEHKPQHGVFDNNPAGFKKLLRWLKKHKCEQAWACLEATGTYGDAVAQALYDAGHKVSVVNPARIKAYGQSQLRRNKTDKQDALLIADYCRTQKPPLWTPPSPAWLELRAMVRHLDDLQTMRQQEVNRLGSGVSSPTVVAALQQHIAFLAQQIEDLKDRIQDHINQHPDLKRDRDLLDSIKGIGPLTAAKLLAEVRDIRAFDSPGQLVAYAGLNPKQRLSGSSIHGQAHISKIGNAALRKALFFPAIAAKRFNPVMRAWALHLEAAGKAPMVIVVAVMRKLLHLAFGVLKSGLPFDPDFAEKQVAYA